MPFSAETMPLSQVFCLLTLVITYQVSDIQNVYQLLQWLGEDYSALLDYEPEMFDGQNGYYLRWTTSNAVMVIFSAWFQDRSDWKNSMPWNFCMFERNAAE